MLHRNQMLRLEKLEALEHLEALESVAGWNVQLDDLDIQLEGIELHMDGMGEAPGEDFEAELEARIQAELEQVKARLEGKGIR
jgi:hypothetical protein